MWSEATLQNIIDRSKAAINRRKHKRNDCSILLVRDGEKVVCPNGNH